MATYYVSSGQVSSGIILNNYYMYISSGGMADNTTVNSNGYLRVSSGGIANSTTVNSGYLYVFSGGTANSTTVNSYGSMGVYSGGTANSTTVNSGGVLIVDSGGKANSTIVNNSGRLYVSSGGTADSTTVNGGGLYVVSSGGMANSISVNGGHLTVSSGGTAYCITVKGGGLYVSSGGTANTTTVNSHGYMQVCDGNANSTTVNSGSMHVFSGGTANSTTVNSGGSMYVYRGGTANSITVNWNGYLYVSSGGMANSATVNSGGSMYIYRGGTATILYNPWQGTVVSSAGANVTYLERDAAIYYGGRNRIISKFEHSATDLLVTSGNSAIVFAGGSVNSTTVNTSGSMLVSNGGTANSTTVNSYGYLDVYSGGTANSTTINSGRMTISGGVANSTTVNSYGSMRVFSGGTANSTTVNSGGRMYVARSGKVTGSLQIASGAVVSAYDEAEINFDLTNRSTTDDALVNNLSLVRGTLIFTITVSSKQAEGNYKLAGGTSKFNQTITVCDTNDLSGVLAVNRLVRLGGKDYMLNLDSNLLSLTVSDADMTPPDAPTAFADITTLTNQNVTARATFSEDSVQKQYSLDDQTWFTYTTGIIFRDNGTVYFRGIDAAGNISNVTAFSVSNIDKIAPDAPTASANITTPTNQNVTVTAVFSEDSMQQQYSLDNSNWSAYTTGIIFSDNGTVYFRGLDAVGNISDVTSYMVNNIYKAVTTFKGTSLVSSANVLNGKNLIANGAEEKMLISSGGMANSITINSGGNLTVSSGGTANFVNIASSGALMIHSGGSATGVYVSRYGALTAKSGTMISGLHVLSRGSTGVSGNQLYDAHLYSSAWLSCLDRTVASGGVIGSDAQLYLGSGAAGSSFSVARMGTLYVDNGGSAYDTRLEDDGRMIILGEAYGISAAGASICLGDSAFAIYDEAGWPTSNSYEEDIHASGTVLNSSWMLVYYGASATETEITSNSWQHVYWGGSAVRTQITSSGYLTVHQSGTADTVYLHSGGYMRLYTGAIIKGDVNVGGKVTVWKAGTSATEDVIRAYGARVNFALDERKSSDEAIITDLGMIMGATYSVSVSENQQNGTYRLAEGATDFSGSITVKSADSGFVYGNLSVGKSLSGNGYSFSLSKDSDILSISVHIVDTIPPVKPTASANITTATDQSVTVTATFSEDSAQKQYSFDNKNWTAYTTGIVFNTNGTVYFRGIDAAGNVSAVTSYTVGNITQADKVYAASDINGNGISDVMFQYTGGDYQIGFWMDGTNNWQGQSMPQPQEWELLGAYDMGKDGKADALMRGNITLNGVKGAYIGYYKDGDTTNWQNISYLNNELDIQWDLAVGNITGTAGANSIVWHAPELCALGVWTDGTDTWIPLAGGFNQDWKMVGTGDFDGNGKDEVLFSYSGGLFTTDIDQKFASLGGWGSEWNVRAIGDFSGDGKDDIVLFHGEFGTTVKFEDGLATNWTNLGQLDAQDWFIVGAGDYNGDRKEDLLVRQYSTGMLGYYENGDMTKWVEMGRGVDMNWTVVA